MEAHYFFTIISPFGYGDCWVFNPSGFWQCPETNIQVYLGAEAAYILPTKGRTLSPRYINAFSIIEEYEHSKSEERKSQFYYGRSIAYEETLPLVGFQKEPIFNLSAYLFSEDGLVLPMQEEVLDWETQLNLLPFIDWYKRADEVIEIKSQGLPEWEVGIAYDRVQSFTVSEEDQNVLFDFTDGTALCMGYASLELKFREAYCSPLARQFPETWDEWLPLHLLPELAKHLYLQAAQVGAAWSNVDLAKIAYWENTLVHARHYGLRVTKPMNLFLDFIARYGLDTLIAPSDLKVVVTKG